MSEDGKRPGGLTVLAVLNFVFGGLGALGLLIVMAALGVAEARQRDVFKGVDPGLLWTLLLLGTVTVGLQIASGVGYLGQKRWGRTLGNAFAVCSLGQVALGLGLGQEFSLQTILGLVYPVLTLVLLNTTFKEDMVR